MTARPLPWMKFSPDRWQRDEALRMCSAAARGVWMELICIMHRAEPYGHLLVRGKQPTDRQLSVIAGVAILELSASLAELEANEVFERNDDGVIFCRGMVRDWETHVTASQFGKVGAERRYGKTKDKKTPHRGANGGAHSQPQSTPHRLESENREREDSPPVGPPKAEKHLIPDDWEPEPFGADSQAAKIRASWDRDRFDRELEDFRSHHRRKGSRYSDWQEAWGSWVRKARGFDERDDRSRSPAQPTSYADTVLAEVEEGRTPARVTAK